MTADDSPDATIDTFYDALEALGQPVVTAARFAQQQDLPQSDATETLDSLVETGDVERQDVSTDPVVYYPSEWSRMTDRERVIVFPERRQLVVDKPRQFTRAQLSQFARLVDTTGSEGYLYEITQADIWQAPYDDVEALLSTVRDVLPERQPDLEDWIESQWERAHQFVLRTHEDGYVVLEAASEDLMGNVARQKLDDDHLRAPISDTESWVAEESIADVKRILYEAGYPVVDERDLDTGEPLPVDLQLDLRPYQHEWVQSFLEGNSGVLVGPPGSGKTVAAMGILSRIEGETLVLVPGRELVSQWRDELLAHTTLTADQIGEYHGGTKEIRPVTIATYQTAGMDRHRHVFDDRKWGLIVFDECLSGDTIVHTENGRRTFEALDESYSFSEGWNDGIDEAVRTFVPGVGYEWTDVTGVFKSESPVEEIMTNTGQTIRATPDHTHIVFDPETCELLEQKGVSEGDFLVVPLTEPPETETETSESLARAELLGWFLGDGHMSEYGHGKFSFGNRSEEQIAIISRLCDQLSVDYSTFENERGDLTIYIHSLCEVLAWDGPRGDKTSRIAVPAEAYNWSPSRTGALLRGLFDAEGSVDEKHRIQFNTVSTALAADVRLLLQKVGIITRSIEILRPDDAHNTVHRITIPTYFNDRFERLVGFEMQHKSARVQPGTTPETALPVGPYLEQLKTAIDAATPEIADMAAVAPSTLGDVCRNKYRLGQPRLDSMAHGLAKASIRTFDDIENARTFHNVTYESLGERLDMSTSSAYQRIKRHDTTALSELHSAVEERRQCLRTHAARLSKMAGLHILEVDDVEHVGTETVYDFETTEGTFIADGFLTHNCHHIPSDVFRRTADLQSRHRLGLSATPLREDDREEDIFTLVGPPIGTDWDALFDAGFVAEPSVEIRYVPWADETAQNEYVSSQGPERRQLAASNPAKVEETRHLLRAHEGEQALVFVDYLDQGRELSAALDVPFVSGETRHARRSELFESFRSGMRDTLIVSRVGDEGIDLPSAQVAIVASGLGGSRRQSSQRAGRTMRPEGQATMYVLATRGSREEDFARQRMRHLAEKGVRVTEHSAEAIEPDSS